MHFDNLAVTTSLSFETSVILFYSKFDARSNEQVDHKADFILDDYKSDHWYSLPINCQSIACSIVPNFDKCTTCEDCDAEFKRKGDLNVHIMNINLFDILAIDSIIGFTELQTLFVEIVWACNTCNFVGPTKVYYQQA